MLWFWLHDDVMEKLSASLALCDENSLVNGGSQKSDDVSPLCGTWSAAEKICRTNSPIAGHATSL